MVTRSILGVPALRTSFLDDVSATEAGRGARCRVHARGGAIRQAPRRTGRILMSHLWLDDGDEDPDDDDDAGFYEDDDADEDNDDEDGDDEDEDDDVETWQVCLRLTSQAELPRLARIPGSARLGRLGRSRVPDGGSEDSQAPVRLSALGIRPRVSNGGLRVCQPGQSLGC